jgi:hypothetical protein
MGDQRVGGPADIGDVDERVAHALLVERVLTRFGWFVLVVGVATIALIVWQFAIGDLELEQALEAAFGAALATVLSGAVAYGSGTNVGLGAARLALSQAATDPAEDTGTDGASTLTNR